MQLILQESVIQPLYSILCKIIQIFIFWSIKIQTYNFLGNTVTVMSPDGTPVQVNASAFQAAAAGTQNAMGII